MLYWTLILLLFIALVWINIRGCCLSTLLELWLESLINSIHDFDIEVNDTASVSSDIINVLGSSVVVIFLHHLSYHMLLLLRSVDIVTYRYRLYVYICVIVLHLDCSIALTPTLQFLNCD